MSRYPPRRVYPVYLTAYEAESVRRYLAHAITMPKPDDLKDFQDGAAAVFAKLSNVVALDKETHGEAKGD